MRGCTCHSSHSFRVFARYAEDYLFGETDRYGPRISDLRLVSSTPDIGLGLWSRQVRGIKDDAQRLFLLTLMSFLLRTRVDRFRQDSGDSAEHLLSSYLENGDSVDERDFRAPCFNEKESSTNRFFLLSSQERNKNFPLPHLWQRLAVRRFSVYRKLLKSVYLLLVVLLFLALCAIRFFLSELRELSSNTSQEGIDADQWIAGSPWTEDVLLGPPTSSFRGT